MSRTKSINSGAHHRLGNLVSAALYSLKSWPCVNSYAAAQRFLSGSAFLFVEFLDARLNLSLTGASINALWEKDLLAMDFVDTTCLLNMFGITIIFPLGPGAEELFPRVFLSLMTRHFHRTPLLFPHVAQWPPPEDTGSDLQRLIP